MELAIYAHPWDLRALPAHGGLLRLRDLGFAEVALAASYHAGRWLTPWHPDGMVRFHEDGTVHFRPRGSYGRLQPKMSAEVPATAPSPLEWLCAEAPKVGMRARAWAVACHNSRLGELHPDCCARNAFGDRYLYSLCPAQPEVQRYLVQMVTDLAAQPGLAAVELEALGWLGHRHNSHHDKSSFPPDPYTDMLLSLCLCDACAAGIAKAAKDVGSLVDPAVLRQQVAALLRAALAEGDALAPAWSAPDEATKRLLVELGEEAMKAIAAHRVWCMLELGGKVEGVLKAARVAFAVQGAWDGLRGGPQLALALLAHRADQAVLTCYGDGPAGLATALPVLAGLRREAEELPLRLGIHPRAPQFASDADLDRLRGLCAEHGIGSVAIYHLGLLPWRTIERVARALHK